ncbi:MULTISPECIES: metallophosphoesterase [Archaeoglobus]|jgi:hypothetical protein|uniref:Calcineurin-like phosphoesterase domain-containing protein n=3 Tax=Archaeoglobus fulgidus TaxID=2234 RepID=O29717_ARCFU|nr:MULTISPECIES: metallophosphoesterase [Archaeoglobus]AAB90701.1 conserved hypothetical protein [Archaeoglobus fulgidus DSM 4304]AIG97350.1 putative phosphoesterase [Archaeoglobus fulgidus DSM 8774]KUJ93576.1 MAG: hypothetical protein XD40_1210 [Archaeoglobus fulgidus]KUK07163.1 MAG: hypothetical protein XD48_0621 [Archaeoglobus fulgidus]MDI3496947.1 uncharacterized protein [Archaeoglobus sp.]
MRVLLLSDIHSSTQNLEKILKAAEYDAVFIAGDLTQFRPKDAKVVDEIISEQTDSCLAVHGNCDHEAILGEKYKALKFIHGKSVEFDGYTVHGVGGSGITPFNTPSEYTEREILEIMDNFVLRDFNILLSHCPPKGFLDRTYSGVHAGCEAIRERMIEFDVILCGHIHESHGVVDSPQLIVNPGPVMWGRFAVIDVEKKVVELRKL